MLDFFDYWQKVDKNLELLFVIKEPVDKLAQELQKRNWSYKAIHYTAWVMPQVSERPQDLYRNSRNNTKATLEIDQLIQEFKPDVVMTNTIIAPWAAFAAKLNGLPHVWFVREYGDIDHGHEFEIGREQTFRDIDLLSDLVVTNSQSLTKHVAQYVEPSKVVTLYTPFKIDAIKKRANESAQNPYVASNALKIVMVGMMKRSKGQQEVVEAIAQLKKKGIEAEVCFVGGSTPPEFKSELKNLSKKNGVSKSIHFAGPQSNPYPYIKHADVAIMASRMEAFGRVTFEYLCLGKPVIGAASGGTLEMVQDGKNGFLYDVGDVGQIIEKLKVYAQNPATLKKHQAAAKDSALHMVTGEYGADELLKKINKVMGTGTQYRLPGFTRRWLNIPATADEGRRSIRIIDYVRRAIELGPRGTYHRAVYKIQQRANRRNKG